MSWIELLKAKRADPFSVLNRERVELGIIKDLIKFNQLDCQPLQRRKTQPLGTITITMPTESEGET